MKTWNNLLMILVAGLLYASCQESNPPAADQTATGKDTAASTNISFTVAQNYFVKNTVGALENPRIESASQFEAIFGTATTMGKSGQPTPIDFEKQSAIAVVLPETDTATTLSPVGIQYDANGNLVFTYKKSVGASQSFTIRPNLIVLLDKNVKGGISLQEQR